MKTVKKCRKSTIAEAWVALIGSPALYDSDEIAALSNEAAKRFLDLKRDPTIVVGSKSGGFQPAFWTAQFSYASGLYLARTGHRYLSVHILCDAGSEGSQYQTYPVSLEPELKKWLEVYDNVLKSPTDFAVATAIFGYRNRFVLPAKDFDVSDFFKVNFGIEVEGVDFPLVGMSSSYDIVDSQGGYLYNLKTTADPSSSGEEIVLETLVTTEKTDLTDCSIADHSQLQKEVLGIKDKCKGAFFGFATAETHKMMEAEYAE